MCRPVVPTAVRASGPARTAGPYCVLQYGPQARPVLRTAVRAPGRARSAYCSTCPRPGPHCVLQCGPQARPYCVLQYWPQAGPVLRTAVRAPGRARTAYCSTGRRPGPYCALQYGPQARPALRTALRALGRAHTAYCTTGPRPGPYCVLQPFVLRQMARPVWDVRSSNLATPGSRMRARVYHAHVTPPPTCPLPLERPASDGLRRQYVPTRSRAWDVAATTRRPNH